MTSAPTPRGWDAFDRLLALGALAVGALIALRAPGLGDYPTDAGPALSAIAHGSIGGFFAHQPAMGALSLYLRAPFVILAAAFHDSPVGLYRWGDLPCVLSVALLAIWIGRVAASRGMGRPGRAAIVAICLGNPLVANALLLGHPEELLTASLVVGSLLAASERRVLLSAVLAGLAVASKQWALLIVCPVLLAVERERIRAALSILAVAVASTIPMVIGNFASFRHAIHYISTPEPVATLFSWLYPFSHPATVRFSLIFGDSHLYTGPANSGIAMALSHPVIIALGVVVPLLVWLDKNRQVTTDEVLLSATLVLLLRCTLDPGSWPYYHAALLLTLVAYDAIAGRKLPVAGLAGIAAAFVVLDRFPAYFSEGPANLLYILVTVAAAALLVRELRRVPLVSPGASAWRAPSPREQAA